MAVPLILAVFLAISCTSLAGLVGLSWNSWRRTGVASLLPYRPRPPVPWDFMAPTLLLIVFAPPLIAGLEWTMKELDAPLVKAPDLFVRDALATSIALLALTGCAYAGLAVIYRATRSDLGLPAGPRDAFQDAWIGIVAATAAFLPVMSVNLLFRQALQPETQHPFIEQILGHPSLAIWSAVTVSAVVAAPWFEETVFRLILQGWLEKWERRTVLGRLDKLGAADENREAGEVERGSNRDPEVDPGGDQEQGPEPDRSRPNDAPVSRGWIRGIPGGWCPIAISSTLFGLAHWGHGVDPIALTLLGVVFGYVYHRTGRIFACVVAHALFNMCTMVLLALEIEG